MKIEGSSTMDDRDKRRARTPPRGVREQTAGDATWDDDMTPLPPGTHEAIARVDRRVKRTGTETVDRVDRVRDELRGDVRNVDRKVDELSARLLDISAQNAQMAGQVELLVSDRQADRSERSQIRTETVRTELEIRKTAELADVEVDRTRELARIEEEKKSRDHRRAVAMKVLAGIGVAWGAVSAALLSRGC